MYLARVYFWLAPCALCQLPPEDGETVWIAIEVDVELREGEPFVMHQRCLAACGVSAA